MGEAGNTESGLGRKPDPQGGRVHNVQTKINLWEAEALAKAKKAMEARLNRPLKQSEFIRLRILNGGEPVVVDYPPPPIDTRREKPGSGKRRKPVKKTIEASR